MSESVPNILAVPPFPPAAGNFVGLVERIRDLTPDIKQLRIVLAQPTRIQFRPGQTIRLKVPTPPGGKEVFRNYSIANPPEEDGVVELIIRHVPGGLSTGWIFNRLREGEEVRFTGPFGRFGLSEGTLPMIWIAGGSGMSPFWSMLRHMSHSGIRRACTFFFGMGKRCDLFFLEEMRQLERQADWFRFVPALADPAGELWEGEVGLVTEVVDRRVPAGQEGEAYLCGPPGLIDSALTVLAAKGISADRIHVDKFMSPKAG
jgi:Na+-transporting NADH:ubiquinone oxidoreductase subunit F